MAHTSCATFSMRAMLCTFVAAVGAAACSDADISNRESGANPSTHELQGDDGYDGHERDDRMANPVPLGKVIPLPVSVRPVSGQDYILGRQAIIGVEANCPEAARVGEYLAALLRPATGYPLPVRPADASSSGIVLLRSGANASVGPNGYELDVSANRVIVRANSGAGLFAAVQTIRQLLPANIEGRSVQQGPWKIPGGKILDYPKYDFRSGMLDVARHFFPVSTVKRYIDHISRYKMNYFHLHLSDDQGWRIQIDSWPRLTTHGGSTQVGGGPGGYYTKADYAEIVNYAAARYITVIPEIDMPGHTNAALASVPELNCNNQSPPLYTGTEVGFSSFCMDAAHRDVVTRFVTDVIRELSEITPGPFIHLGGDEAHSTTEEDYKAFEQRVLPIAARFNKRVIGWHEILKVEPATSTVGQYWGTTRSNDIVKNAAQRGHKILLSPANKAYLDMKYDENTELGLDWAGYIEVRDAYDWTPSNYMSGVPSAQVLGVEAPLWSETIVTLAHIEYMIFPRLPAIAERGWSSAPSDWDNFKQRLASQGPRWRKANIGYYASPQVPWL